MNVKVNENKNMRANRPNARRFTITEVIGVIVSQNYNKVDESLVMRITHGQQLKVDYDYAGMATSDYVELSNGEMLFGMDNVIVDEVEKIISEVRNQVQIMVRKYLEHARFAEIFAEQKENLGEDKE